MSFIQQLRQKTRETGSIVCLGMDPIAEKIPLKGQPHKIITKFYIDILEAMRKERTLPAIAKPNVAYFGQYGIPGMLSLKFIIKACKSAGIPVLLDAKRGDIGKSSQAYAKGIFEDLNADATTVNPYMGSDSVMPFTDYCKKGKGVYVLVRTSNPGAKDFQDLKLNNKPLYMHVADKLVKWHKPGVSAVVGATSIKELQNIAGFFAKSKKQIPLLIPGVGAQGGSAAEVVNALKKAKYDLSIVRINSSSAINYAYIEQKTNDYAGAAVKALKNLSKEIGKI